MMQERYPHEIKRFADGQEIPDGYVELTDDVLRVLEPMRPEDRADWLRENQKRSFRGVLKDVLNPEDGQKMPDLRGNFESLESSNASCRKTLAGFDKNLEELTKRKVEIQKRNAEDRLRAAQHASRRQKRGH